MGNTRLREAMEQASVRPGDLASELGIDPKTVQRWVTGRVPHRSSRLAAARVLGVDVGSLWPHVEPRRSPGSEVRQIYPTRGAVPADLWRRLADQAHSEVDILAYAAMFLFDSLPDVVATLTAKARSGLRIRLLLGDPDGSAVMLRGEEEGLGVLLAARCRLSWFASRELRSASGTSARRHDTTLYASLFRFDDDVIVNTHLFGAPAAQSPYLHARQVPGGNLVASYRASFERVWFVATPTEGDPPWGESTTSMTR